MTPQLRARFKVLLAQPVGGDRLLLLQYVPEAK
jgi:hypothetical protein